MQLLAQLASAEAIKPDPFFLYTIFESIVCAMYLAIYKCDLVMGWQKTVTSLLWQKLYQA